MQQAKKLSGPTLYTDFLKIPAALLLLIAFTGLLVLYHHVPAPANKESNDSSILLEDDIVNQEQ